MDIHFFSATTGMDFDERVRMSQELYGPEAVFSHVQGELSIPVFVRKRPYWEPRVETALQEALDLLHRTYHGNLHTYLFLKWRSGQTLVIIQLGPNSYNITSMNRIFPLAPHHTHTEEQLVRQIVVPFFTQGSMVQFTSNVLQTGYKMTSAIRQGDVFDLKRENALTWNAIPDNEPFYYLLQNVSQSNELRHMYTLKSLQQLPFNNHGKRRNPFTQQPFDFKNVREGYSEV